MTINKPNGVENILANGQNQIKFDFDQSKAIMSRVDDALQFDFGDGNILKIADFYKVYNKDNKPTFIIEDREITCDEFFTAMGAEDMIPYLGNSSSNQQHGRSHEYSNLALLDGIDRLGGLDLGFNDSNYEPEITGGIGEGGELDEPELEPEPIPPQPYSGLFSVNSANTFEGSDLNISLTVDNAPKSDVQITVRIDYGNTYKDYVFTLPKDTTTITIPVENLNTDDVFVDPSNAKISIVGIEGGDYDDITVDVKEPTVNIEDTIDDVHFTVVAGNTDENSEYIPVKIISDDPGKDGNITVTIDVNGTEYVANLQYANDHWEGYVNIPVRNDDLFINGDDSFTITVTNANHNGLVYENPVYPEPVVVKVVDDADEVHFDITASNTDENSDVITFTVTSNDNTNTGNIQTVVNVNGTEYDVVLDYINGQWIGTLDIPVREDDVFVNGTDTYVASVVSASHDGKEYENPTYSDVTVNVTDDADMVTFSIRGNSTDENAENVVFTITSNDPKTDGTIAVTVDVNGNEYDVNLEYVNGEWTGTLAIPVRADNVFIDGTDTYTASIKNAIHDGLTYEKPFYGYETVVNVTDDADVVHFAITGTSVDENAENVVFTITSDDPKTDGTIHTVVEVNGKSYTVDLTYSDGWIGTLELPIREDDAFINGTDTYVANIISAVHDNDVYENPAYGESARIIVTDDNDEVHFTITGQSVDENAENVTFNIVSDDKNTDGTIAVTVDVNGKEHTVNLEYIDGQWQGTLDIPVRTDDVFVEDDDAYTATITNAEHIINNENYVYENPKYSDVTVNVVDDADEVHFNIETESTDENDEYVAFNITSNDPKTDGSIVVTVDVNGDEYEVTLEYGNNGWSGTLEVPVRDDNVFIDGQDEYVAEIIDANHSGMAYENPIYGITTAIVTDDFDEVNFNITGKSVDENAENVVFTITSDDPETTGTITVKVDVNGTEYSVDLAYSDGWTGTLSIPVRADDVFVEDDDTYTATITSATHSGKTYENPVYGDEAVVTVVDDKDEVNFNITGKSVDENADVVTFTVTSNDPKTDGTIEVNVDVNNVSFYLVTLTHNGNEWVGTFDVPVRNDNVFVDSTDTITATVVSASHNGMSYEKPIYGDISINVTDDADEVHFSITAENVDENATALTFTVTSDDPKTDGNIVVTVDVNGQEYTVTLEHNGVFWTGTFDVPVRDDNGFIDGTDTYTAKVVEANHDGLEYENPKYGNEVNVLVTDDSDAVHFFITGQSVDENAETITFNITSDDKNTDGHIVTIVEINNVQYEVTLNYNDGWSGTVTAPVREDNVFIDGTETVSAIISSAYHIIGNENYIYENPVYDNISVNVTDDQDPVHFTITADNTTEKADNISFTITSDDPKTDGDLSVVVDINGASTVVDLEYVNGQWQGNITVPIRENDIFINDDDTYNATITSASHSGLAYEKPVYGDTSVTVTDWIDEVHFTITGHDTNENAEYAVFDITSDDPKTDGSIVVKVDVNGTEYNVTLEYGDNGWAGQLEIPIREDNQFIDEDDAYVGKIISASHDELTYEKPVYGDESVLYVTDDKDKVEFHIIAKSTDENDEFITYTITSNDKNPDGEIIVNVEVNEFEHTVELEYVNGQWVGEFTSAIRIDDKFINGTDTFKAEITEATHVISGKEYYYEDLNLPQSVTVTVVDDEDPVYFNISSNVKNDNVVFTITSDDPKIDGDLSVTVDINGTEYVVEMTYDNGWTGTVEVPVRVEDIFVDDTEYYKATIINAQHDNLVYEKPVYGETTQEVEVLTDAIKLTVDESFVETGTHRDDDTGSDVADANLGWFAIGTSNIVEKTYELAFDNEDTGLQALYSKNTYDIHLIEENNVIYGRITTLSEREIDIFEISVDENGHITLELTGNGTVKHPDIHNSDESLSILNNVKVILTETNADNETRTEIKHIDLAFEDDAPYLDVHGTNYQEPVYILNPNMPHNLEDCGPAMDFTQGTAGTKFQNNLDGLQYWAAAGVELSAAIVQFDETGKNYVGFIDNPPKDALEGRTHYLEYSGHNNNANKPWNWGLNVQGKTKWEHGKEISYDIVEHQGQGVVFDLGGKLAYGVNIEFGAVYDMSTSVMQNDLIAPESAVVLFFRNGEFIGQETAGDLSSGSTQRYFGAAVVGGFDKVIVTVNDNDSFDPHPRNQYQHVSDNEFTIRSIDFDTMSNDIPVYAVEGKLDINMGSDGAKGNEHDVEFMPGQFDNFTAIVNGEEHDIHMEYSAGNMYVKATDDDGNVLFVAAVGSDGSWEVRQYANFEVKGNTEDGKSMLPLYFKTGQDADGDYSTVSVPFQTNYVEDVHNSADVSVHIQSTVDNIISYNLTDGFESVPVTIKIDTNEEYLKDGTIVNIIINSGDNEITHTLTYDGQQFTSNDGFNFNYDNGVITWDETHIPNEGQLLKVNVEQKWIDEETEETISFRASDTAQPELIDHYPLDNNMTIGTEGNDVLNYHPSDILVDGDDGLDILLNSYSDSVMYSNKIQNIEVELNGNEVANIKNASDLAKYGITVENNRLELNENSWQHDIDNTYNYVGTEAAGNLSLTLSEDMVQQSSTLVFILENGLN